MIDPIVDLWRKR